MHPKPTLFNMDWQGVVLLRVLLLIHLWEGHSQVITNPLIMMGYPQIRPSQMDPPEGGVGAEEAEVARVVVTPMGPPPLGEDVRKKMDFQVKSRSPNSEARRAMLTSVSNLGKDWKDKLTDKELQSLQYEVSLNRVRDSQKWRQVDPSADYEAVKRYETYVARNKRLEGKGASSSASQLKAAGHTLGYKPRFHKTMAFTATIPESEDNGPCRHESSSQEGANPFGAESSQEDDKGLFIPSYLEEALPDDPVLQVKMAHAM